MASGRKGKSGARSGIAHVYTPGGQRGRRRSRNDKWQPSELTDIVQEIIPPRDIPRNEHRQQTADNIETAPEGVSPFEWLVRKKWTDQDGNPRRIR